MHKYAVIVTITLHDGKLRDCNHSICILRADANIDDLYRIINKFLSQHYAVIYAVGSDGVGTTNSQLAKRVIMEMRASHLIENVEDHVRTGALRIVNIREIHSPEIVGNAALRLKKLTLILNEIKKKKFRDVAIIAEGKPLLLKSQSKLVDYEKTILVAAKQKSIHVVCCYLQESLDEVQFAQLAAIVNAHQCNIVPVKAGMQSRKIASSDLLNAIIEGIEYEMGRGSGRLVIRTMKMVYKINEEKIVSDPSLFQEKLQKMLGSSSETVLNSVNNRIKEILLLVGIVAATHYMLYSTILSLL